MLLEAESMSQPRVGLQIGGCKSKGCVRIPAHRKSASKSVLVYGDGSPLVFLFSPLPHVSPFAVADPCTVPRNLSGKTEETRHTQISAS